MFLYDLGVTMLVYAHIGESSIGDLNMPRFLVDSLCVDLDVNGD
jgi:hypothetical protein